jgi:hypothetical protein
LLPTIRSGSLDRYLRKSSLMLDPIWGSAFRTSIARYTTPQTSAGISRRPRQSTFDGMKISKLTKARVLYRLRRLKTWPSSSELSLLSLPADYSRNTISDTRSSYESSQKTHMLWDTDAGMQDAVTDIAITISVPLNTLTQSLATLITSHLPRWTPTPH